ncbi:MAG: type II toxin-antitoxin system RelB/DinJ family antitoxin [Streptococcaceae bacterium]|jgi:DNA-damage-inducible protein J|nr:type II toxin-antitoxin system RelB/DinJ family antitoxin [Streptococcaceae bacterium]
MTTVQKTYRIDEELQQRADYVLSEMGMNSTTAINMFLKRVVAEEKLPFTPQVIDKEQIAIRQEIQKLTDKIPVAKIDWDNSEQVKELLDDW